MNFIFLVISFFIVILNFHLMKFFISTYAYI